jgi:hypothetical protein
MAMDLRKMDTVKSLMFDHPFTAAPESLQQWLLQLRLSAEQALSELQEAFFCWQLQNQAQCSLYLAGHYRPL